MPNDHTEGDGGNVQQGGGEVAQAAEATPGAKTPQGTMVIVLLYAVVTVILWFYMYYIVLESEGLLGGR